MTVNDEVFFPNLLNMCFYATRFGQGAIDLDGFFVAIGSNSDVNALERLETKYYLNYLLSNKLLRT